MHDAFWAHLHIRRIKWHTKKMYTSSGRIIRLQYKKGQLSRCLLSIDVFFGVAFVVAFSERWRRLFSMLKDSESRGLFLFASIDNNQINKNKPWSSWTRYTQFALSERWKFSVLVQYLASSSHANTIGLLRTRSSVFCFSEIIEQFFAIWIAE